LFFHFYFRLGFKTEIRPAILAIPVSSIESLEIADEEKQKIFEGTALSILNNV